MCKYDTSNCFAFNRNNDKHKHSTLLWFLAFVSVLVIIVSVLLDVPYLNFANFLEQLDFSLFIKICAPVCSSILAALLCAKFMDIPGRMKEYKSYFINLLSSSDYLKSMSEADLGLLRAKITTQLHLKDVPNMPKGLIKIDEKVLDMLKKPYYKDYNQSVEVSQSPDGKSLKKTIKTRWRN